MAKINNLCSTHQRNPEDGYCATCSRIAVERKIVMHAARAFIKAGYEVAVCDGEEITLDPTTDKLAIERALFTTDEDYLFIHRKGQPHKYGWVRFIYGNSGPDVCNDYTTNLEHVMSEVNDFAERQTAHNG